jgi:hypothetical protein
MAIPGTIPVTGIIAPTASNDTYAVIDPIYGIDGLRSVANSTERNAITSERKREGMLVYQRSDSKYYKLLASPWNGTSSDWIEFSSGSSSGGTSSGFDVFVTGGTYTSGTATFTNNTGGTFTVNGFSTGGGSSVAGWSFTGDSISSGQFVGTNNNQDLVFKRNGVEKVTLTSADVTIKDKVTIVNDDALQLEILNSDLANNSKFTVATAPTSVDANLYGSTSAYLTMQVGPDDYLLLSPTDGINLSTLTKQFNVGSTISTNLIGTISAVTNEEYVVINSGNILKKVTPTYGSLVAGTNISLGGTIANRLVGTGNVTINYSGFSSPIQSTGATIQFDLSRVYNTSSGATTSNITNDLTNAKFGVTQKIYHNHSTVPTFPANWKRIGNDYVISVLNIIYAEYVDNNRIEYWITQES